MSGQTSPSAFVVLHITTTGDDLSTSKDSSEILEIAWSVVDSHSLAEIKTNSSLVKPLTTPVTPLCTSQTSLTWENVKNAPSLKDCVLLLEQDIEKHLVSAKRDFTFVVFNSWDLRMRLPKESREKNIQLPSYLEHSRYFDLRKEYLKFQQCQSHELDHPGPLTVSHIVSALDLDVADIKPVNKSYGDSLTLAMPRRAADEVQVLVKVIGHLQKTSPQGSKILETPYDMALDLAQFASEKSRILYMSNLPADTTQSELESWFTQYGGRPVAFWTVKIPPLPESQNNSRTGSNTSNSSGSNSINSQSSGTKPACSGFAVFATHEEALDSLAMTGRLLNDRIIEVQPSSTSVLDKAHDILTPFPSSKNRPRPGDWTCPSCGFSNFQRRTACFRCSFPAASAAAVQESISTGQYYHRQSNTNSSSNVPFRAGDWKCPNESCAYHNFAKNVCCLKCGTPKPAANTYNGYSYHQDAYNANMGQRRSIATPQYHHQLRSNTPGSDTSAPGAAPGIYNLFQYPLSGAASKQSGPLSDSASTTPLFQPMLPHGSTPSYSGSLDDFQGLSSRINGLTLNSQPLQQAHSEQSLYHSGLPSLNLDLDLSK
ncbi:hypothetical protein KL905_003247 [Ogataea polymorpha]|uniref:uncharacterized protein n=1 Tax=Ogataea polymorpha TaxID=460523 RepID=UPI0007F485E8|nr:uncharacterized protein OGAPODRAFT_75630 [Ogataea polymorpha]KAG7879354.1 hypothetical protein KL937_003115 [Ogataea polymorpha]KAG7909194.1 hypothetical protein KL906_002688 [Ogataea polymorpha]KAG7920613.1 hypothetical protein KL905_003247 [Ogataea polymorpha]KAG7934962.1 hypothetical protein KL904_003294 [Ogataea polymorpha]KAG7935634.1 hypothetical protein KL934_002193 [Ogataea polymorpha]